MVKEYDWYVENKETKSFLKYSSPQYGSNCEVSIVIPTYKRGELLFYTLESIIKQDNYGINYEIVVVDNENDEQHIMDMINRLKEYPNSIKYYVNEKNVGLFGNWNMCIRNANSKIVSMLHDDDILFDGYFEKIKRIMPFLDTKNWFYVKTRNCFFEDENKIIMPASQGPLGLKKFTSLDAVISLGVGTIGSPTCGSLFNRDVVISMGGFNPEYYPSADTFFPVKMVLNGYKMYITTEAFGGYRLAVNVSGKPETMVKTLNMDRKLCEWIGDANCFAKLYSKLFTNAKLEKERLFYISKLSNREKLEYEELKKPFCSKTRLCLFNLINVIRKSWRVINAIRVK